MPVEWIRSLGPSFEQLGGRYLLPAAAMLVVALRFASRTPKVERFLGPAGGRVARPLLLAALVVLALLAVLAYANFFHFHYGGYVNAYEFFHYYMGSKYAPELGYFGLYEAALVADEETGRLYAPADGLLTHLETHHLRRVDWVLAHAPQYRALFNAERWREFVADVRFFKQRLGPEAWNRILRDKGYNATPVWTAIAGRGLSDRVAIGDGSGLVALALLDVLLLATAVAVVGWVFGVWPALLLVVLLGASYLTAHVHMKGAFLRTDFVVAAVLSACALKRGHRFTAGALMAWATLSRLFPAVLLFGLLAKQVQDVAPIARRGLFGETTNPSLRVARAGGVVAIHLLLAAALLGVVWAWTPADVQQLLTGRWGPPWRLLAIAATPAALGLGLMVATVRSAFPGHHAPHRNRFFAGFVAALLALVGLSLVVDRGAASWIEFAQKISVHRAAPHIWDLGLATLVYATFDVDAVPPEGRTQTVTREGRPLPGPVIRFDADEGRRPIRIAVQAVALLLTFLAVRRMEDWEALLLGFVPFYFLVAPTYYYYILLVLPLLFFASRLETRSGTAGTLYLFLLGLCGFWFYSRWDQYFPTYYWNAVLLLGLASGMLGVGLGRQPRPSPSDPR